jgi:hypothetical protein
VRLRITTLLWIAATTLYWWWVKPMSPTFTVSSPEQIRIGGFQPNGELAIVRHRELTGPGELSDTGPVEFWDVKGGQLSRRILDKEDWVFGFRPLQGVIPIRRNGRCFLVDASTAEIVGELPFDDEVRDYFPLPGGQHVLYTDGSTIRRRDIERNQEIWSTRGFTSPEAIGPDFLVVSESTAGIDGFRTPGGIVALNLATGLVDQRFDHLGPFGDQVISPDGRYSAFRCGPEIAMCDARSGKELWRMPNQDSPGCQGLMGFSDSGMTFFVQFRMLPSEICPVYRNSSDGREVFPTERQVPQPRYALSGEFAAVSRVAKLLNPWLIRLGPTKLNEGAIVHRVVDLATSRTVGSFYRNQPHGMKLAPDGTGLAEQQSGTRINYYRLPPPANWGWLARWTLLPPAVAWVLVAAIHKLRRRRSHAESPREGQPAAGQSIEAPATLT